MSMETDRHAPQAGGQEGYERSDADVRSLLKFGLALFVILVLVLISMKSMFFYFAKSQQLGPPASPFENARVLPPQPWLQVQPRLDLQAYCQAQVQELNSYAWVDPHNEVVRIPVDRAIGLILQRGLPARAAGSAAPNEAPGVESKAAAGAPEANDLQGSCGYLVKLPAPKEEK